MRSYIQVLTTPTADTPGTTLLLHFDNKRYLIGSLAEGTQRASVQMGARLLKVGECFITGRTEWSNTGGLIGMILTLADAAASSASASAEEAVKRAKAKAKRLGVEQDKAKVAELTEEAKGETSSRLTLFSAPNLNHTLATARRFVFRKGMPIDVHEIDASHRMVMGEGEVDGWIEPYWADDNVKVWAMSVLPSEAGQQAKQEDVNPTNGITKMEGTVSPRKRSIDEVYDCVPPQEPNGAPAVTASSLTQQERDQLTVKAVVGEMFNSSWRLDTLYETPLSQVRLPASMFIRNPVTNKIERYTGPLPGGKQSISDPDMTVLVRKPWPGALVESLPPTQPKKEAVSYIIKNHTQRGKFHPEQATKLKVGKGFKWAQLAKGESVLNEDGETVTPEQVLGESKEGGGLAVVDLPDLSYIKPLLKRPEWKSKAVMAGIGAMVWICGPAVATDSRLCEFMAELKHIQHVVSSPELCPNNIALDSVAASTVRLRQVDPQRYSVPVHENSPAASSADLPSSARVAIRGQTIQLEPSMDVHEKQAVFSLDVAATESEMSKDVLDLAARARDVIHSPDTEAERQKWMATLPHGAGEAEITTLGTGSALPSKYRNVSATLLRVPGWGSMLFDCGENTLGQLKRVFSAEELKVVLKELRMIWISHMHADHHLGTVGVIKAWYQYVHGSKPLDPKAFQAREVWNNESGLAVVSEPAMQSWLYEYAQIEDYGFSRLAPLYVSAAAKGASKNLPTKLGWFVPATELSALPSAEARKQRLAENIVSPEILGLRDLQAIAVQHCHGARAVSVTFPSTDADGLPFKVSYSGDCRPSKAFGQIGKDSTVCIHEATFDDELLGDAQAKNHSTTSEALSVAQAMGSKACVLTHFSQRYQKLPVLDRGTGDEPAKAVADDVAMMDGGEDDSANPEDDMAGPLEDAAATFPDQQTSDTSGQQVDLPGKADGYSKADHELSKRVFGRSKSTPEAVKFKLASDMKICVAFDYMRVKVGEIPQLEKFTPALLKLFEEEDKTEVAEPEKVAEGKHGKKDKKKGKGQRGNA